jgi:predicted naringenin-chalcone synthase
VSAFINRIGTANPAHDVHDAFVAFASATLVDPKSRAVFDRMAGRAGIAHRFSHMRPGDIAAGEVDADGFFRRGDFPGTAARMIAYAPHALDLARAAIARLAPDPAEITHLIVASCTGFTAPGLDLQLAAALGLRADVARTMIGFMGCAAAIPALRAADHAVRADPGSRVLVVNLELCSLHLQETDNVETALSLLLFGDGASAALVTADPVGIALGDFRSVILPDSADLITWTIGDHGFLMHLSGQVPNRIAGALRAQAKAADSAGLLRGRPASDIANWAVHGGGRTVLDAVEIGLDLAPAALRHSRAVLHDHGNMSSATIMFVLVRMLEDPHPGPGIAMAFGPGMVAETFAFDLIPACAA